MDKSPMAIACMSLNISTIPLRIQSPRCHRKPLKAVQDFSSQCTTRGPFVWFRGFLRPKCLWWALCIQILLSHHGLTNLPWRTEKSTTLKSVRFAPYKEPVNKKEQSYGLMRGTYLPSKSCASNLFYIPSRMSHQGLINSPWRMCKSTT